MSTEQAVPTIETLPPLPSEIGLPPHFLRATLNHIGGEIISEQHHVGLLLPAQSGASTLHVPSYAAGLAIRDAHPDKNNIRIHVPGPITGRNVTVDKDVKNGVSYAFPNQAQAEQARQLQMNVWGSSPEACYRPSLYHPDAGLATQLVSLKDHNVNGFLLGFHARGENWYGPDEGYKEGRWLESQALAVDPEARGTGIGTRLKQIQRMHALQMGYKMVTWTYDPLNLNSYLNLNVLGGVAAVHSPNHYPSFKNALNAVPASRVVCSWFLDSGRVAEKMEPHSKPDYTKQFQDSGAEILPAEQILSGQLTEWQPQADTVFMSIPPDWNGVQQDEHLALAWRTQTDEILAKMLGNAAAKTEPKYALTGLHMAGDTPHLLAKKTKTIEGI